MIIKSVCVAGRSLNAADAMRVIRVVRTQVSVRACEWDYLCLRMKKSFTIPAYYVMIKE